LQYANWDVEFDPAPAVVKTTFGRQVLPENLAAVVAGLNALQHEICNGGPREHKGE